MRTRNSLGFSQAVFARCLGVSGKTVPSWEQGKKVPKIARRFLDEIRAHPARAIERVKQAMAAG